LSKIDKALEYLYKGLDVVKDEENNTNRALFNMNIGTALIRVNEKERAIKHLEAAIELAVKTERSDIICHCNTNLGAVYFLKKDFQVALDHYLETVRIYEKLENRYLLAPSLCNAGSAYKNLSQFDKAEEYLERGIQLASELNSRDHQIGGLRLLAENYLESGQLEKSLIKLDQGLRFAQEVDDPDLLSHLYMIYEECYLKIGAFEKAHEFLKKYHECKSKVSDSLVKGRVFELETKYESERKAREAEIYRLRNVELVEANTKLQKALDDVDRLGGLLPICANCKKIRDDKGYWNQVEQYFSDHSDMQFSHGICPECFPVLYPEFVSGK